MIPFCLVRLVGERQEQLNHASMIIVWLSGRKSIGTNLKCFLSTLRLTCKMPYQGFLILELQTSQGNFLEPPSSLVVTELTIGRILLISAN